MKRVENVVRVAVATASQNTWIGDFGMCLANLVAHCARVPFREGMKNSLHLIHTKGSILPKSRWLAVRNARLVNADWLLFVDSDQIFPEDTIHRLLRRNVKVVGANVAVKKLPSAPTARAKSADLGGRPVYTDPRSTGIEQVWRLGCGVLLIDMRVLDSIPKGEMFNTYYREDIDDWQGEDWTLMEALEKKGIAVYVDHDLSKEVAHVGFLEFTHDLVGEVKTVRVKEGSKWLRRLGIR